MYDVSGHSGVVDGAVIYLSASAASGSQRLAFGFLCSGDSGMAFCKSWMVTWPFHMHVGNLHGKLPIVTADLMKWDM